MEDKGEQDRSAAGFRLVHIVLLETLLIAIVGFAILGSRLGHRFPTSD